MPNSLPRRLLAALLLATPLIAACAEQRAAFSIVERRVAARPPTLRVQQGDTVVIDWRSDEAASLHLHGYNIMLALKPGQPGQMRLQAGTPGRFAMTAHGFGEHAGQHGRHQKESALAYLEVLPK